MKNLQLISDPKVKEVFKKYPDKVRQKMLALRQMILEVAQETEEITDLQETLKWSEPAYLVRRGSTIRMDWKPKSPEQYALYFKCTSKLVPTFKKIYQDTFEYEGDRAIIFKVNAKVPEREIKKCIKAALTYHKIKHLNLLGF